MLENTGGKRPSGENIKRKKTHQEKDLRGKDQAGKNQWKKDRRGKGLREKALVPIFSRKSLIFELSRSKLCYLNLLRIWGKSYLSLLPLKKLLMQVPTHASVLCSVFTMLAVIILKSGCLDSDSIWFTLECSRLYMCRNYDRRNGTSHYPVDPIGGWFHFDLFYFLSSIICKFSLVSNGSWLNLQTLSI